MLTHNTHYATKLDKVFPISGQAFSSILYSQPNGDIKWLCHNRRLSFHLSSAARFSSFSDAKAFCDLDYSLGRCEIVVFRWSTTSYCYWSSHSYCCLGGQSDRYAGLFCI